MGNTRSIEFQDIKKDDVNRQIVRSSFRVPVDPENGIKAVLNGKSYRVVDISLSGISIACDDKDTNFIVAQTVDNCELKTRKGSIKNLTGKIVHFSCGQEQGWQNGIQWIEFNEDASKKISTLVISMKDKLLKKDSFPHK